VTGGYLGPEGVDWKFRGDLGQTPIYITTAKNDDWVPPARVEETAAVLKLMNAKVKVDIFEERPHEISPIEIPLSAQFIILSFFTYSFYKCG
jgi:phospholipase/carboxylesterase